MLIGVVADAEQMDYLWIKFLIQIYGASVKHIYFILFQGPLKEENNFDPCLRFLKGFWDSLYLVGNMVQNLLLSYILYVCFRD